VQVLRRRRARPGILRVVKPPPCTASCRHAFNQFRVFRLGQAAVGKDEVNDEPDPGNRRDDVG
jgi:hypothetical protein